MSAVYLPPFRWELHIPPPSPDRDVNSSFYPDELYILLLSRWGVYSSIIQVRLHIPAPIQMKAVYPLFLSRWELYIPPYIQMRTEYSSSYPDESCTFLLISKMRTVYSSSYPDESSIFLFSR
jgi:hypothetical protein